MWYFQRRKNNYVIFLSKDVTEKFIENLDIFIIAN